MNQSGNRRLLHRRWVYRTLREVWLVDEQVVEKRFLHHPGRRDWRPLWQRGHRALERLAGLPVPRSLGWHREMAPEGPLYILRKTYLAGRPLHTVTPDDARYMGSLLCALHGRGVVNNDPAPDNFIRTPDGTLACVDFGRSRTFHWRSLYFYFYVGKELARLHRTGLTLCPALWTAFLAGYYACSTTSRVQRLVIQGSYRFWLWSGQRHHAHPAMRQA
mgnify:CR=1 FL=1